MTEFLVDRVLELQKKKFLQLGLKLNADPIPMFDSQDNKELKQKIERLNQLENDFYGLENKLQDLSIHNKVLRERIANRVMDLSDLSKLYKAVLEDHKILTSDIVKINKLLQNCLARKTSESKTIEELSKVFNLTL